jgi:hypothetical protein
MPIFVCDQCDCVDNTALGGNYWSRLTKRESRGTGVVLCAECVTGTWHGEFPKVKFDPATDPIERLRDMKYVPQRHRAIFRARLAAET